ncbi:hypothetical protein [Thauera linaloolentis]|uniref:Unsaturated glucuronyl hydrolase n=1 Tax=Thauera linaloolentis (strain DSM 12138 / JCM 21573 / CCUG 41526 / CIP 105981 / IAM 15112 / NBRC 102519 / 47Lol) TaxID=1123367 RepID=N6YFE7_THAL4|nr:hypothetical protein [Thauera linaloolentis]ENO90240.1 unsaturated glucuronyl hydrolase [Thauera linaloolentis 47Lol = DSM 12138]MCM8566269.1 hypothetical protein [Thauera linaloolentis]
MNARKVSTPDSIDALFGSLDGIAEQCGDRFPLFRPAAAAEWTSSRRGSWLGGFWAGLWWLRAARYGRTHDLETARIWSTRLASSLPEPSINRSFVFWYGAAVGYHVCGNDAARRLAVQAAHAIAGDFDPSLAACTVGPGMGAGEPGARLVNVDALAPTLALLHDYGGTEGLTKAHLHLQTCLRYLATEHGAWRANAILEANGIILADEAGAWPRGQAWAMLGMAEAVRLYGLCYRDAALQACIHWMQHWGEGAEDGTSSRASHDPSAQAIAAVAMLKLYRLLPDQPWLLQQSRSQISSLLLADDIAETGRFVGHLYHAGSGGEEKVESSCATFFLLEALLDLRGHEQCNGILQMGRST